MGTDDLSYAQDDGEGTVTRSERDRGQRRPNLVGLTKKAQGKTKQKRTQAAGFRCRACGHPSSSIGAAEGHAEEAGHPRIECV